MKKIIITNRAKLGTMIADAEGRASVRKLTPEDVEQALERVSERLFMVSTKKDAIGTRVEVDVNAQTFPIAYKYIPESTHFTAVYKAAGWKVETITRQRCWTRYANIYYTDATIANMAARMSYLD